MYFNINANSVHLSKSLVCRCLKITSGILAYICFFENFAIQHKVCKFDNFLLGHLVIGENRLLDLQVDSFDLLLLLF